MRVLNGIASLAALCTAMCVSGPAGAQHSPPPAGPVEIIYEIHHDVSPALRDIPNVPRTPGIREIPLRQIPRAPVPFSQDAALQSFVTPSVGTTPGLNFAGVGNGDYGFAPNAAPPDTNGAIGLTQYVQWVNESFAVFNKTTGAIVPGFPKAGNTLWAGFGGGCETNNDGDPVVAYDKAANRWVMTQFSVSTTPFLQCVAVSTTSDATGTYNRYSFTQPNFNDYPKIGVWPDGYYISFNMFNAAGTIFLGGRACAFDRAKMLTGAAATQVCFQLTSAFGGLLPSDLDGSTPPPAGSPNFFMSLGNNNASMDLWKFHVDFATPANSTFTNVNFAVPAFTLACGGSGATCVVQPDPSTQLDTLGDRLMHRLAYRNLGDHEAIVANHSVTSGASVAVRWYEIRSPNATPTVFQSGTFAPDATFRWMGSIAMDKLGDIAVGYSASSSAIFPSLRYTGRVPGDALGTLQAENIMKAGAGSQNGGLTRWGDYSAMTIDPVDDCTFWYTNEYQKANGAFNWSTQIGSFSFPSCTSSVLPTTATTLMSSLNPANAGQNVTFTATVTGTALPTGTVNFKDGANSIAGCNLQPLSGGGNTPQAMCTTNALTAGTHSITAVYGGDANNQGSTSLPLSQVINGSGPGPTTTTITSSKNPAPYPSLVQFTATVTGAAPTGSVTFKDGATTIGTCVAVMLSGAGKAVCNSVGLSVGTHSIVATYNGDANNASSSSTPLSQVITGAGAPTATTLGSSLNPSTFGAPVTITATVTGTAMPTGNVNFKDGASSIAGCNAQPLSGGGNSPQATCLVSNLTVGTHSITAVYGGNAGNLPSTSAPLSQVVNLATTNTGLISSLNPANAGQNVTFTATVNGVTPGGTVNFKDGASSIASCVTQPLSGGGNSPQATCTVNNLSVGTHSITAVYSGDAGNQTSTSAPVSEVINSGGGSPTTTTLLSSLNPANAGQNVTFTATVNGTALPTGTVDFKDGANSIAGCNLRPLNGGGNSPQATCTVNNLSVGTHSITAVYSGDAGNLTSTSAPPLSQVINSGPPPATVSLSSSRNPSPHGFLVMFRALVTGVAPTGTVNFTDGGTTIPGCGTALVSGSGNTRLATCITTTLSVGTHSIVGNYSGDANNGAAASAPLSEVIQ